MIHHDCWCSRRVLSPASTRDDECDLCPSCSVGTNHGTAHVLLHVLLFLLRSAGSFVLLALSSLLLLLLLILPILLLLRLSLHPFDFLHFHSRIPSLDLQFCLWHSSHSPLLPAENQTSFIETYPHVHGVHPAVHVQLDDCAVIDSLHDLPH